MAGEVVEVELTGMAHGGSALGRQADRMVFIPYAIPGERVRARIVREKGRSAFAEGLVLLEASADRVFPRCPHFGPGRCGRCQWQHIAYPAQLLLKQDVLADQLARIGGLDDADVRPVIPSADQWGYNYQLSFEVLPGGGLGLPAADDGRSFAIETCHILHPDLLALLDALDLEGIPGLRGVKLQMGSDGGRMVVLLMETEDAPELLADLPASVNLLLPDNEPVNLIGDSHVRYTVAGHTLRATAGSAFRGCVGQLDALADAVLAGLELRGGEAVLDLYAGVGVFSAAVARLAGRLTVVESYPPAVTDADANLAAYDQVDLIEGAVEDVLGALDARYDAVIADPPAAGLSGAALDGLAALDAPRLVYVSGDPASLARDAARLARAGYRLVYAQPLDLAPQTFYLDTVAVFQRR